jgi:iron complex outermembrane receptor protein
VTAALDGFRTQTVRDVVLSDGGSKGVDFILDVALTVTEKVDVIGSVPMDSMEAVAIRQSPARDVGEALTEKPGVWKVRKGGIANDVVLRGFQRGDLNVLIDGQRLYGACPNRMDPASFHVDFAEVDRVELAKGPYDMKNQGSLGGTVNIVTRKPEGGWHASANFAAGSYSYINPSATVSYGNPKFSVLGGYSFRASDPFTDGAGRNFTELANYNPGAGGERAFEIGTAWGRLGWNPVEGHQIRIAYTRQDVDRVYYPYLRMDAVYDDTDRVSLGYEAVDLSELVPRLSAQGYFNQVNHWMTDHYRTSSSNAPRGYSMGTLADTGTTGGKVELEIKRITLGMEVFERFWGAQTEMAGMAYKPQYSIPDVTIQNFGFYAEYASEISTRLTLSLGGRLDRSRSEADENLANTSLYYAYKETRSTSATDTFPSGKVRLTYGAGGGVEVSTGIGHIVRVAEASEKYFALKRKGIDWVGNPELDPSRNTGFDVAASFDRPGLYLGASVFVNRIENFITIHDQPRIHHVPGIMNRKARSYVNVDAALRGAELDAVVSLTDQLFLSGDISYVRGTKTPVPELGIHSQNLPEIPPLRSRIRLRFDNGRYFAAVDGLFSTEQDNVNSDLSEETTPGFAVANLKLGARVDRFSFTVGVDNIFDKLYMDYLSYYRDPFRSDTRVPEPGRNLIVNVMFRY